MCMYTCMCIHDCLVFYEHKCGAVNYRWLDQMCVSSKLSCQVNTLGAETHSSIDELVCDVGRTTVFFPINTDTAFRIHHLPFEVGAIEPVQGFSPSTALELKIKEQRASHSSIILLLRQLCVILLLVHSLSPFSFAFLMTVHTNLNNNNNAVVSWASQCPLPGKQPCTFKQSMQLPCKRMQLISHVSTHVGQNRELCV